MAFIPRVENFLFCYSLRTGILFISSITIVCYVIQLLTLAFVYDSVAASMKMEGMSFHDTEGMGYHDTYSAASNGFATSSGLSLGLGLAAITLNVLLIIGVLYKKPGLFLPWLAIAGFSLAMAALGLIGVTIFFPIYLPNMPAMTAGIFFLLLICIGCYFHVFSVVHTYYQQLQEPKETSINLVQKDLDIPYSHMA